MLKRWAWQMAKPIVVEWLRDRALVIPAKKRAEIAKKVGVAIVQVEEINAMLIANALDELDRFRP